MTPEKQQIAIAEAHTGLKYLYINGQWFFDDTVPIPNDGPLNYLISLDAMHEAEKTLSMGEQVRYATLLAQEPHNPQWRNVILAYSAPATQRAEAFLRTIGKWEE